MIDNQEGVREPLGMSGVRLEAKVHVVTCAVNASQNIEKCVRRCGLEVDDIILEQLASAYSVLTEDEKEPASYTHLGRRAASRMTWYPRPACRCT